MVFRTLLMLFAFAALVSGSEVDENDQKKRGAGKTTLNAIPTGAQKPDYTYSIYQSPGTQASQPSPSYHSQVSNSFYPTQGGSQYYSSNLPTEASPQYPQQPQINLIPPPTSSQFVPLNFVPNSGYQTKYQIVPSKSQSGNIQVTLVPQPQTYSSPSVLPYSQYFTPNPTQQISQPQSPLQGNFNLAQNYQFPFSPFIHPQMLLLAQPNPSLYNNFIYPNSNPVQSLYNYYPSNSQAKYSQQVIPPPSPEYEKIQGPVSQSITKDDNDLAARSSEYLSDPSNYKNAYTSGRTSYSKL